MCTRLLHEFPRGHCQFQEAVMKRLVSLASVLSFAFAVSLAAQATPPAAKRDRH